MAKSIGVLIRKNKNGNTFYCRLWYPPTKNSRNITLGKKTEAFGSKQALERLDILKDNFKQKNYNYKLILKQLDEVQKIDTDLTLNEVAKEYFDKKFQSIKTAFLNDYKDRFEFTDIKQLDDNPVFRKKAKHFKTFRNYYKNHVEVEEWKYEQQNTARENKPKQKLTKVGVIKYSDLGLTKITDISKKDIETWMTNIQNRLNLQQKTKHNLISQLKTIFNFAITEEYLEKSPFEKIKKEEFTKNPHNFRERLLDVEEMDLLMTELYTLNNKNSFNASLIGLACGCRVNSALNIRKSDFKHSSIEFTDYYTEIDIINFKTKSTYTLPLVKEVGKYFYYLLKDWESYEYVIRPMAEYRRLNQPMVELPSDFKETTDRTINASIEVKELYLEIEDNNKRIKDFEKLVYEREYIHNQVDYFFNRWKNRNKDLKEKIKKLKKEYLADKKTYLKVNFSFHNFRHQLVSLTSIYNPLYAKRILNHSPDRFSSVTERYIKSDMHKIKEILEKALKVYIKFLIPINDKLSKKYDYERLKSEYEYKAFEKPKKEARANRRDFYDMEELCAKYMLENNHMFNHFDLDNMTKVELQEFEELVINEYELKLEIEEYKISL